MAIIDVQQLVRIRGTGSSAVRAVDGISFQVEAGEIFGLLGPNGAGKTSTIETLEGLDRPDGGVVRLFGLDVTTHAKVIKQRIGVQLQTTGLPKYLTVHETLELFTSFYPRQRLLAPDMLLRQLGLEEKGNWLTSRLSGGERQRLALALALVNDPDILFLDEPSSGLDPHARRALWMIIREWSHAGKTVFLTTHDMHEAETLCERVAIMDRGRIVAQGRVADLLREHESEQAIWVEANGSSLRHDLLALLPAVSRATWEPEGALLYSTDAASTMSKLLELRREGSVTFESIQLRTASLEDVFLKLTGRRLAE
jgi:ABC-2 type transport system ATP-binding protein